MAGELESAVRSSVHGAAVTSGRGQTVDLSPTRWAFHALTRRELRRRMWHMAPGLLAFAPALAPHADPISTTLRIIVVVACLGLALHILKDFRQIQRLGEGAGVGAVAGYSVSVMVAVLMLPRHLEIGLAVLAILAFGDGTATLFGLMFRGPRLPWNRAKSWSGFVAFLTCGSFFAATAYWIESRNPEAVEPAVSFLTAWLLVVPAVLGAALIESIRSRINDNIRVGIVSSLILIVTHFAYRPF